MCFTVHSNNGTKPKIKFGHCCSRCNRAVVDQGIQLSINNYFNCSLLKKLVLYYKLTVNL